jgi:enediyne biosynthesis protein E4
MTINGHLLPQVEHHDWGTTYAERPLLFHNVEHGKRFEVVPAVEGTGLADVIPGRGAAFGDLFNNGKIDVVVNCIDHTPVLLRNVNADTNHWVGIQLVGGPKSPRDAIGATVYVTSGAMRQRGDVMSGGSYESSNDQRLHFGLGQADKVDAVEVRWPSGSVEHISLPSVDRFFVIEEGKGLVPSVYDAIAKTNAAKLNANPVGH